MTLHEYWARQCLSKKRYKTYKFAVAIANKFKSNRNIVLYVYPCPSCAGFHHSKSDWENKNVG